MLFSLCCANTAGCLDVLGHVFTQSFVWKQLAHLRYTEWLLCVRDIRCACAPSRSIGHGGVGDHIGPDGAVVERGRPNATSLDAGK